MRRVLFLFILICSINHLQAQLPQPYILNGSATQRTCNCYVLTPDAQNNSGTAWNKNKINLTQSFDYSFEINLGSKDGNGADGIGFILQTQGTNLGATGQGLGFAGISPSLGILIDTYQNDNENDPSFDHVSIQINGVNNHGDPDNNLTQAVQVRDGVDNIEDGQWHLFRINWNAATFTMEVSIDHELRLTATKDLVTEVFGNDPSVFWGFAGSTGGSSNLQQFCAALRPDFAFSSGQILCDGTPVTFTDNSSSFGTIVRRWWDLGDGTTSTAINPPPHLYAGPGIYQVRMVIEDNSGCVSDTLGGPVTIGSYPVVNFGPDVICLTTAGSIIFDSTIVDVGTKDRWEWDFGSGNTSTVQNPRLPYTTPGNYNITLSVTSLEGCESTDSKNIRVAPSPEITASGTNVCLGEITDFSSLNISGVPITEWYWTFNGDTTRAPSMQYLYPEGGSYTAQAHAISDEGCPAIPVAVQVEVIDLQLMITPDTIVAKGQPLQLSAQANGNNLQYTWTPSTGLNNPFIADPIATLQRDQEYHIIVESPEGCRDEGMISIKAYTGPEFYVPNAFTPNGDGRNDVFRVIAPGVAKLDFLRIWNRWGQEMFSTADFTASWDGSFKGRPADIGTYVWMVQGVDYLGRSFSRQGTVTLIR